MRGAASLQRAGPLVWLLLAGGAALVVGAVLAGASTALAAVTGIALIVAVLMVWTREPRRLLIVLLFMLMPLDISKAFVAPDQAFFSPGLYVTPAQFVAVLLSLVWLLHQLFAERRLPRPGGLGLLVLLYLAWLWFSAWRSPQGSLALASAMAYTLCMVGWFAASQLIRDATDLRWALGAAALMVLLELGYVAAQMATQSTLPLPGSKSQLGAAMLTFGGAGFAFRPAGFFSHPNVLGHHMVVVLPAALALVLLGRRFLTWRVRLLALAVLVASSLMLLLTLSRGGWAAAVLGGFAVVVVFARVGVLKPHQLAGLSLLCVIGAVTAVAAYPQLLLRLTGSDERSIESRVLLSDQALTIIRANPVMGVGYGGYNRASFAYNGPLYATVSADFQEQLHKVVVHNGYLLLAAELGIPAMLLFIVIFLGFVRLPWPLHRWRDPAWLALAIGLSAGLLGQLLYVSSDNYYADVRVFMLWLSAGLLQAVVRIGTREAEA